MSDINSTLPVTDSADGTVGSTAPTTATEVAGSDGTNLRVFSVDTTGKINVNNISGTVSLPTGASTSANQTNGSQKTQVVDGSGNIQPSGDVASRGIFVKPTDGTNTVTVKPASTAALATDTSLVTSLNPNTPLPTGSNIIGAATTGIVQTTAPSPKSTSTATQNTTDEYSRIAILLPESINSEWGQMFGLSTNTVALTGTTETAYLYFKNPNASGKNAKILAFTLGPTLGNNYVTYRFYIDPTVSANGSAVTINGNRQTGQNSSIINAFTGPTVSANGTLFDTYVNSGLSGSTIYVDVNFCLWVEPNHSLLVTRQLSANATIGGVSVKWTEQ